MNTAITKRYTFEAAHHLEFHQGHCRRPHGHSYKLEVTVAGPVKNVTGASDSGMVLDFHDLNDIVKPLLLGLDHFDLNVALNLYPTAEHLAAWLFKEIAVRLPPNRTLERVALWETETGRVEVTP